MGFIKEFKEFASKGSVVDLAVGVIIGGAFGKIVASLVNDLLMPFIGLVLGGVNFKEWKLVLKEAVTAADGTVTDPGVTLGIGNFIQTTIDFLIIAFVIFLIIKAFNNMKKKEEEAPTDPPEPSDEVKLLTEIRDSLKK
ncbi:MAG: large-conductance mechanosensitive channel [Ignavibacteria bacterium GWF2_33_9]|nr:MAG: large-conductance mechanosensitive channel [Ignavibacteria bacterium GWF2_33_9]